MLHSCAPFSQRAIPGVGVVEVCESFGLLSCATWKMQVSVDCLVCRAFRVALPSQNGSCA